MPMVWEGGRFNTADREDTEDTAAGAEDTEDTAAGTEETLI